MIEGLKSVAAAIGVSYIGVNILYVLWEMKLILLYLAAAFAFIAFLGWSVVRVFS